MTGVYIQHVREALLELSDVEFQQRVWTGRGGSSQMASFTEAVEQLVTDSGLGHHLEKGNPVFGTPIDDSLRRLVNLLRKVDGSRNANDIVADPTMRVVRDRAASILRAIDDLPPEAAWLARHL